MEVRKEGVRQEGVVDPVKVNAQHLEDGEDDVQAVGDVEGGEDVVEAVAPHVLAHQHHNAHKVAHQAKTTKG